MGTSGRLALGMAVLLATSIAAAPPAAAGGDWNDAKVGWQPYDAGIAAAKKDKKPVLLVFFTEWCPHCTNYSKVFHDDRVVERSKKFVMIRLDKDKNAELSKKYAPDGEYIPRTYFLSSDGALDAALTAPRDQYKYFYDEHDPAQLLAGMDAAIKKLK
ncbi:MAG: thioredoxin family protein [Deltaproteobacteria bacterium]|nr:thioredoxin family protein [Deltaproteobacteria bacterium]